jgi:hypothetical protein
MKPVLLLTIWFLALPAAAQTFPVVQKRTLWPDGRGELVFTGEGIEFRAAGDQRNSRKWRYIDIQHLDRVNARELVVLTYEDRQWRLGQDREFRFLVTEGEFSDALFENLRTRLRRPATDRVAPESANPLYEIPVKHLHTLGGCEGTLSFTGDALIYRTSHQRDARDWRIGVDVESVWSRNPYELEVHVYERNAREFSRTRVYHFALKEPLDAEFYRGLKLRLYRLSASDAL